jgi:hypothetical protein
MSLPCRERNLPSVMPSDEETDAKNVWRHHEAGEQDPAQPVSQDKASEVGETPDERVHGERHNSHHRDHR